MKDNALMFLGIPLGVDMVTFNAHRIYGRVRIPMLIEGLLFWSVDLFQYVPYKEHKEPMVAMVQ